MGIKPYTTNRAELRSAATITLTLTLSLKGRGKEREGKAYEAVSQCHSEAKGRRISKNVSSVNEILPLPLHFVQGQGQNDKKGVMTQPR